MSGDTLEPGSPHELMSFGIIDLPHNGLSYWPYAVSPDGQRFLITQFVPPATAATSQIGPDTFSGVTIAVNWASGLKK